MLKNTEVYKIRDGVDIYLIDDNILQIYFMNTRKQLQFKANQFTLILIESINGQRTLSDIRASMEQRINKSIELTAITQVIEKLIEKGIVVENNPNLYEQYISQQSRQRYDRQLNFFGDFFTGAAHKYEAQKKIEDTRMLVFGCGAVGGWMVTELAMSGVSKFILFDGDRVDKADISRHNYFREEFIGKAKVDALGNYLREINPEVDIVKYDQYMTPETDIQDLISQSDFVINTADEPYIGYTSLKISRECLAQRKAHYIAGGFDAHLASTGELIIPGLTPCVDCYAEHFTETLKDWKPRPHPVSKRDLEIGGLSSMSLFSASYGVIQIIKFIAGLLDLEEFTKSRGEFLFDTLKIQYLDVQRDEQCQSCGGITYENTED